MQGSPIIWVTIMELAKILMALPALVLSGCIYIPIIEPEPYQKEELSEITAGKTTRQELERIFGDTRIEREDGSIWVYREVRRVGYMLMGSGSGWVPDYQFLVAHFDGKTLQKFELIEDRDACSVSGICLHMGWTYSDTDQDQIDDWTLITSKRDDDVNAKLFLPVHDACMFYIYMDSITARVSFGDVRNVLMDYNSYLLTKGQPGKHSLEASMYYLARLSRQSDTVSKEVSCNAGDIKFLEVSDKPWKWGLNPEIKQMDSDIGRKAIRERRLILLPEIP